ncbi:hypothetical protein EJ08DRAFT_173620 [Tothia fuscella]|uniref:Uncharacterized protein n=1 Tax=Tothia fuscella TaxID=1048955 RepID=A0A9P4NUK8_9PEZI|nr:hypothetical protein EJ08DRAFT_173620 [Tothia fuscella]
MGAQSGVRISRLRNCAVARLLVEQMAFRYLKIPGNIRFCEQSEYLGPVRMLKLERSLVTHWTRDDFAQPAGISPRALASRLRFLPLASTSEKVYTVQAVILLLLASDAQVYLACVVANVTSMISTGTWSSNCTGCCNTRCAAKEAADAYEVKCPRINTDCKELVSCCPNFYATLFYDWSTAERLQIDYQCAKYKYSRREGTIYEVSVSCQGTLIHLSQRTLSVHLL